MRTIFLCLFLLCCQLKGGAQDTLFNVKPGKGLDKIWRSSDLEGERGVLNRKNKRPDGTGQLPDGSVRVGCICMDYIQQKHLGRGACSGRNGVRFWLYKLPNGDTARIATLRHDDHPDTLSDTDILRSVAFKRYERLVNKKQWEFFNTLQQHPDWLGAMMPDFLFSPAQAETTLSRDTVKVVLPPLMPFDNTAQNTLLSLKPFCGFGCIESRLLGFF
jgi:hypothetical protein